MESRAWRGTRAAVNAGMIEIEATLLATVTGGAQPSAIQVDNVTVIGADGRVTINGKTVASGDGQVHVEVQTS